MTALRSPSIPLGKFDDYDLYIDCGFGMPAALVAHCSDTTRSRHFSPRLFGDGMINSNPAIREAFVRAVRMGYASLIV